MHRFPARATTAAAIVLFTLTARPPDAMSQDAGPCAQEVALAENMYAQARFEEVVAMVTDCIGSDGVTNAIAVRGYRILALAFLRNDAVGDARLAVIELFARDPAYEADPVQDLPAYVALVNTTREQLDLTEPEPEPDPADARPVDLYSASRRLAVQRGDMTLRGRAGWSSYGGERGVTGGGFFGEFVDNGGESLAIELNYAATNHLGVGLLYQVARYPTLLDAKGGPSSGFPTIDRGTSSPWIHYVGILMRGTLPTPSLVKPYGAFGFFTSFGLLNDKVSVGGGPRFAVGVDVAVGSGVGLFLEFEEQILFPGDSSDLTDRQFPYDLFSGAAVGMRYTLTGL